MREIEVKLRVSNLEEIERKLKEKGCIISDPINQHDFIYSLKGSRNEFESASEGDIIIRIRHLDEKAELNLKQQRSSESDNLEYETVVSDPEATRKILEILGWYPAIEVKKIRKKAKIGEYEICLDRVEKLGTFIELEKMANDDADPKEIKEELFKELELLGLSRNDEEVRGYDTQIFFLGKEQD